MALVKVDGSMLEGGGQILRNAAALAAITATPVQIDKIRAGRKKPGLAAQHLTGLRLVEQVTRGTLEGGAVGSSSIKLYPSHATAGQYVADTKTAGSCTLMLQAALPCLVFARPEGHDDAARAPPVSILELRGGTDADMAPPVDYLTHVLAPQLRRHLGLEVRLDLRRRGFYPRGGGIVEAAVACLPSGRTLPALDLTQRGRITRVLIRAFGAGRVPANAPGKMANAASSDLRRALGGAVALQKDVISETAATAMGDGAGIIIVAETDTGCVLGASAKGEKGVPPEATGSVAAAELLEVLHCGACVDQWLQDQLVVFMALASGTSRMLCWEPTLHTRTAMVVAEQMLGQYGVKFTLRRVPPPVQQQQQAGLQRQQQQAGQQAGQDAVPPDGGGSSEGTAIGVSEAAGWEEGCGGLWLVECRGAGLPNSWG